MYFRKLGAIIAVASVAVASSANAESCKALLSQYQAVRELQIALKKQVATLVFDPLRRRTCPAAGLQLLDSYTAVLRKTINAMNRAYPCDDGVSRNGPLPNTGDNPQTILENALSARQACLTWLSAPPLPERNSAPSGSGNVRAPVSCSTITKSGEASAQGQPRQHCSDAGHALAGARNVRKHYPVLRDEAEANYRRAAEAYRKAGDLEQAALTILEMAAPLIDFPAYDDERLRRLEEAGSLQDSARKLAKVNTTCDGLTAAANSYGQAEDHFGAVGESDKARELKSERVRLYALAENRCSASRPTAMPSGANQPSKPEDGDKQKCDALRAIVDDLNKRATFLERLGTMGQPPSSEAIAARNETDAKKDELAKKGCK